MISNLDKLKQISKIGGGHGQLTGSQHSNKTGAIEMVPVRTDVKSALFNLRKASEQGAEIDVSKQLNDLSKMNTGKVLQGLATERSKVELVFLIDKSGSVEGTEKYFVDGYNTFIKEEATKNAKTYVTTVFFEEMLEKRYWRTSIDNNPTIKGYNASGGTSLYDTICEIIGEIKREKMYNSSLKLGNTVVVIMTDGYDNCSKCNIEETRNLITECINLGWKFIFLGAKIDSKAVAASLGIPNNMAEDFLMTNDGIRTNFKALNELLDSLRETGKIPEDWANAIKRITRLGLASGDTGPKQIGGSGGSVVKTRRRI